MLHVKHDAQVIVYNLGKLLKKISTIIWNSALIPVGPQNDYEAGRFNPINSRSALRDYTDSTWTVNLTLLRKLATQRYSSATNISSFIKKHAYNCLGWGFGSREAWPWLGCFSTLTVHFSWTFENKLFPARVSAPDLNIAVLHIPTGTESLKQSPVSLELTDRTQCNYCHIWHHSIQWSTLLPWRNQLLISILTGAQYCSRGNLQHPPHIHYGWEMS